MEARHFGRDQCERSGDQRLADLVQREQHQNRQKTPITKGFKYIAAGVYCKSVESNSFCSTGEVS